MVEIAILMLIAAAAMICMLDWRFGMYVVVAAGFVQDPIRKLFPGEPVVFTLLSGALFGCCLVGAIAKGERLGFREINRWNPVLAVPAILFVAWVLFQTVRSAVSTGSPVLAGIGAIAYLSVFPALLLGGCLTSRAGELEKLMRFYIAVCAVFSLSLVIELIGVSSTLLGSVGEGFVVYPKSGGELILRAGLFRSPEVAGWHAATAICMMVCLGVSKENGIRWLGLGQAALITLFLVALILTGRRKFLIEIVMFLAFYGFILSYFRYGLYKLASFLVVCGTLSGLLFYRVSTNEFSSMIEAYAERSESVQRETLGRFEQMTVRQFSGVVQRNGMLGAGAGLGSQGAQHFGGGAERVGFAAEGGLGKVLAELGVPGIILLAVLALALARYLWAACHVVRGDDELAGMTYGLTAFLISNAFVFATAHQIFGDVYVLLWLGLILSFLLNAPLLAHTGGGNPAGRPRRSVLKLRRAEAR